MSKLETTRETICWPPIQAVTFDVTHTLMHAPRLVEIYWQVLRRHGHDVHLKDVRREIPRVWREFSCRVDHRQDRYTCHAKGARGYWQEYLVRLCQCLQTGEPSPFAGAELFDRLAQPESWEVYPDVRPTLEGLRADGLRLGVVSNWDHRLPRLLERLHLADYFHSITYSSACGLEKPHPAIFLQCLEALGVRASRALHVGDQDMEDIEGAEAAGLKALRLDRKRGCGLLRPLLDSLLRRPVPQLLTPGDGSRWGEGDRHVRN